MTRAELASVLACAMVATPACSRDTGPADSASAFVVTDSSGGRIVRNQGPGALGDSLLPRREDLRIGVVEGAYEFELHGVRDLAVGPAGEIYAALQTLGEIRVFDAGGRYLRTLGGEGEGPGEFRALTWIGVFGDTVLGYDARLSRMTLFWNDGAVLDTWQLSAGGVGARILPRARSEHGWIATLDDIRARVPYGIGQPGTDTTRIAVLASIPEALAMLPTSAPPWTVLDVTVQYPSWTNWGVGTPDFVYGRNPLWEAREHYAIDAAGRIYLSRGSRYAIDVYDATGSLLRRVTRTHEPVPITGALIDRYRATAVAYYGSTCSTSCATRSAADELTQARREPGRPRQAW